MNLVEGKACTKCVSGWVHCSRPNPVAPFHPTLFFFFCGVLSVEFAFRNLLLLRGLNNAASASDSSFAEKVASVFRDSDGFRGGFRGDIWS
uniref:Secreted protein n=1 Tax=Globodera pallida TaxID=36090 RepID=A0A183BLM9_GLOPA